jgi:hypothetical protein
MMQHAKAEGRSGPKINFGIPSIGARADMEVLWDHVGILVNTLGRPICVVVQDDVAVDFNAKSLCDPDKVEQLLCGAEIGADRTLLESIAEVKAIGRVIASAESAHTALGWTG